MSKYLQLPGMLLATLVLFGCGQKDAATAVSSAAATLPKISEATLHVTQTETINPEFRIPGVVEAVQLAKVQADTSAPLIQNFFTAGDLVTKGQLMVQLDPSQYQASVDAANAELLSARANLQQAQANWTRAKELAPSGYISERDYDMARAAIGTARASVAKAEAGLQQSSIDLAHTKVYAPFDGRISKPFYAEGEYVLVQPGANPLFELVQLDPIYVTSNIALSIYNDFVLLRVELKEKGIEIPELKLELELAGGRTYPHAGRFENWAHTADSSSGMIAARMLFPNPDGLLLPGHNVVLQGRAAKEVYRIVVPQKAVIQDQQGRYVLVLDDSDTVRRRNVEVGVRDGANWALREGLAEGERVITLGQRGLRTGTKVEVVPAH